MKNTLDLRIEYGNKAGDRCLITQKEINWEHRKNMILLCEITHSASKKTGSTFKIDEINFVKQWKPVNE